MSVYQAGPRFGTVIPQRLEVPEPRPLMELHATPVNPLSTPFDYLYRMVSKGAVGGGDAEHEVLQRLATRFDR